MQQNDRLMRQKRREIQRGNGDEEGDSSFERRGRTERRTRRGAQMGSNGSQRATRNRGRLRRMMESEDSFQSEEDPSEPPVNKRQARAAKRQNNRRGAIVDSESEDYHFERSDQDSGGEEADAEKDLGKLTE
jgi:hypothetical protein